MLGALVVFLGWLFLAFLKPEEKKPVGVIVILILFSIIFWACYEQAGSSFTLFARDFTDRSRVRVRVPRRHGFRRIRRPSSLLLTPFFVWLWLKMGDRQPSSPVKILARPAVRRSGRCGDRYRIALHGGRRESRTVVARRCIRALQTIGEICLYPVGLSTTTKLAPHRVAGLMMGIYFLSISFGNFAAGHNRRLLSEPGRRMTLFGLFSKLAAVANHRGADYAGIDPFHQKADGKGPLSGRIRLVKQADCRTFTRQSALYFHAH